MKKAVFAALFSALLVFLAIQSCRKAGDAPAPPGPGSPSANIPISVNGHVVDEYGNNVAGASVRLGNSHTQTDAGGYFTFSSIPVDSTALVLVEKAGFFNGSRSLMARSNGNYRVNIRLIEKIISGSFDAASGGTVTTNLGGSIVFSPASIAELSGSPYSGAVRVAAYAYNPAGPFFNELMPGALRGVRNSGERTLMQSFAMMAVELIGSGGQKLQLAASKTATVNFPIPAALRTTAPSGIPLWYFDEGDGLWKEEGNATRNGTQYTGTVRHFSFWNCDIPLPSVLFDATFISSGNVGLEGLFVELASLADTNIRSGGITDGNGFVQGLIPSNTALRMRVRDECDNLLYSANIGPYATDTHLPPITLSNFNSSGAYDISGTVIGLDGQPLARGSINMNFPTSSTNSWVFRAEVVNGQYHTIILPCGRTFIAPMTADASDSAFTVTSYRDTIRPMPGTPIVKNYDLRTAFATVDLRNNTSNFTIERTNFFVPDTLFAVYDANGVLHANVASFNRTRTLQFSVPAQPGTSWQTTGGLLTSSFRYVVPINNSTRVLVADSARIFLSRLGSVGDFAAARYVSYLHDSLAPATRYFMNGQVMLPRR